MHYKIGLDIGITSVGWATVLLDERDEPIGILDLGVRIFDEAENPKDGSSLAKPRREARSARRRLRRHRHRLARIKYLFEQYGYATLDEITAIYADNEGLADIYAIRAQGLDRLLAKEEWIRLLIHLAQRRGFKSSRKAETEDKDQEAGKLLQAVNENKALFITKGYRTVGEMLAKDEKFLQNKRNKKESYTNTIDRAMVVEEIGLLFLAQRALGNPYATAEFEADYLKIFTSQRSFDLGPAEPSIYAGNQIEKMIGKCTFEPTLPRAPKAAFSTEYATLLQKINHMRLGKSKRPLTDEERFQIVALAKDSPGLTYGAIRKKLHLSEAEYFSDLTYGKEDQATVEKKAKFQYLKAYHAIKKALSVKGKNHIDSYSVEALNHIAYGLSAYKNDVSIKAYFDQQNIPQDDQELLLGVPSFSKFGHLSIEVWDQLIPHLELGLNYNEACEKAGYDFKAHAGVEKTKLLPATIAAFDDITNPVVRRAVSQTIKVVNGIIRRYGESPAFLGVELAREMSKNFMDRKAMEKEMGENQAKNERIKERIQTEFGQSNPTGLDIVKLKLWEEQDGICPYSLRPLEIERIFDTGYADVDHIVPYSACFDDGYKNKVLVHTAENRQKGDRLPLQYLPLERRADYIIWVKNHMRNQRKRERLLKEELTAEEMADFKERNLTDTKYIAKLMYNYFTDYLLFAPNHTDRKRTVIPVNGSVTAYMRKRWGIGKIREDGDLHHAVDALVVACISQGMINRVTQYSKYKELQYAGEAVVDRQTGEVMHRFPAPWPYFRQELDARLSNDPGALLKTLPLNHYQDPETIAPIFVSRMPKHKVTGSAHKETIRSPRLQEDGYTLVKKPLTSLKLDKDGEIEGYYKPESDRLLYAALKARLEAFGGTGAKAKKGQEGAFDQPFYKPTSTGGQGPLVKSVKIRERSTLAVATHGGKGIADHESMVRVDVFQVVGEGYYWVPIYIADTMQPTLPNKAVVAHKPYEEWRDMQEEDFIFSLYPNDLIKVTAKKPLAFSLVNKESKLPPSKTMNEVLVYYINAGISVGTFTVINHDKTYTVKSMGVKTLLSLEKYQVDVLGNYHQVQRERRQGFGKKEVPDEL